jgi:hypothetical protein
VHPFGFDIATENPINNYIGIEYKVNDTRTRYELRVTAAIAKIIKDHGVENLPARRTPAPLDLDISELGVRARPRTPSPTYLTELPSARSCTWPSTRAQISCSSPARHDGAGDGRLQAPRPAFAGCRRAGRRR